jgi:hypothetical protein
MLATVHSKEGRVGQGGRGWSRDGDRCYFPSDLDRKEVRVTGEGWEEVFSGKSKLQMWSGKGLVG